VNLTDVQTDVSEIASISPEMGGFGCLDPLGAVKCRGCAHRRTITDVAAGLYRAAIRRLLIAKQSAPGAEVPVVGSGILPLPWQNGLSGVTTMRFNSGTLVAQLPTKVCEFIV
jgi:hypothetical protein